MSDTVISTVFICPKCKYTNPSKSKFCMQCGSPLADTIKQTKKAKLSLLQNGKVEKEFAVEGKASLGKGGDISVSGADYAPNICEIEFDGEKIFIKANQAGVFVEANTDITVELLTGSSFKIGDILFRVEI
jgi:hypothetical protein